MSSAGRPLRLFTVTDRTESIAELRWASSNRLILSDGPIGALRSIDPVSGKVVHLGGIGPLSLGGDFTFAVSADGARVAYVADSPYLDANLTREGHRPDAFAVGVVPAAGGAARLLPQPVHVSDAAPSFSPDGENVVLTRTLLSHGNPTGAPSLMVQSVHGGAARPLNIRGDQPLWSPNGRWIAYQHLEPGASPGQLLPWTLDMVSPSGGKPRLLLPSGVDEELGLAWSPDSTRLAFITESGDAMGTVTLAGKITIFKLPGLSLAADLSPATGAPDTPPQWSPDGKTMLFAATPNSRPYETDIYAIGADGHRLHRIG